MSEHVRSYLLQQLWDVLILLLLINVVNTGRTDYTSWYFQWGEDWLWSVYLMVTVAIVIVSLWRVRADRPNFNWSQVAHWLYLLNEPNGDYRQQNWTLTKGALVGTMIVALGLTPLRTTLGLTQSQRLAIGTVLVLAMVGMYTLTSLLWFYRWVKRQLNLRGGNNR